MSKHKRKRKKKHDHGSGTPTAPYKARNQKLIYIGLAIFAAFVILVALASINALSG